MGQSFSTVFYPDNPKRQRRCEELNADIENMRKEFDILYNRHKKNVMSMEPLLNRLLKALGYASIDDLNEKVSGMLVGDVQDEWHKLKESIDTTEKTGGILMGLASLIGLGGAVSVGVLTMLGVVTVATAGAALAVIGGVLTALLIVDIIAGAIQGAKIRSRLREAINKLFPRRADAKLALERMRSIERWSSRFLIVLDAVDTELPFEEIMEELKRFQSYLAKPKELYDEITEESVRQMLLDTDRNRGSWRDEDPDQATRSLAAFSDEILVAEIGVAPKGARGSNQYSLTVELEEQVNEATGSIFLKQGEDYVSISEKGNDLDFKPVPKEDSLFVVQFDVMDGDGLDRSSKMVPGEVYVVSATFMKSGMGQGSGPLISVVLTFTLPY